ncbi:MAG: rod shape-determining protein RodA [Candidatus Wildermuthbacteria bacterium RIFCSPHIGHO2_01_FULL_48_27b]|uniref:Rod shape-determining protein RodA n=1 Tax=Candidatus Wildermuthbacteria bacterium RIFCSPHIGHO2_01_FULL_48_27b TaxID=1802447 RepID=A0A1G2QT24_9BACT|nr:MAG: rod shape-determining protein RodA [Candidatus Wildermuthbacteria bacterium RIFCSPHIGHO2_01_FULL_48_27b]
MLLSLAGLVTMNSFSGENYFFSRQSIWLLVSVLIFFAATTIDWRFLRRTKILVPVFVITLVVLAILLSAGQVTRGAQSWFQFGAFTFQPSDPAKLVIILMLAKYLSRRHIEIKNLRHILVSGAYALLVCLLVFLQPDFGGALVILGIWAGMVLVSGISKKHLAFVAILGIAASAILWMFVFAPYQKARIVSFIHPLADVRGAGYNAYQSTIAIGSGEIFGKGIGQGSQSKLQFLPEYETDFIFAAFAEEWGFAGAVMLLGLCLAMLIRITDNAKLAATNFETFFGLGVVVWFAVHIAVNAGMNMGILPVTGITFPFMSYGGSHLVTEWLALGIISSMTRHSQGPRL